MDAQYSNNISLSHGKIGVLSVALATETPAGLVPREFTATTLTTYACPFTNPDTTHDANPEYTPLAPTVHDRVGYAREFTGCDTTTRYDTGNPPAAAKSSLDTPTLNRALPATTDATLGAPGLPVTPTTREDTDNGPHPT